MGGDGGMRKHEKEEGRMTEPSGACIVSREGRKKEGKKGGRKTRTEE